MTTLGFSELEQSNIIKVLAAVLHIGNIQFKLKEVGKGEAATVENPPGMTHTCSRNFEAIKTVATLLSLPPQELHTNLCQRINFIRGEKFVVPLNIREVMCLPIS